MRRICDCLPAPHARKSATRHDKYRQTEKLIDEKQTILCSFELLLRSKVKTEASYPRKNKMGNH